MGISRTTVHRYVRLECPPERKQPRRRDKMLDPYTAYLRRRWDEGRHTTTRLWHKIREMGDPASYTNLVRFLAPLRLQVGRRPSVYRERGTSDRMPTPRQVAMLFQRRPEQLNAEQTVLHDRLCAADAALATAHALTQGFAGMVRGRQGEWLDAWTAAATESESPDLWRFAVGLLPDKAAIHAGLREEWSNGQAVGHVDRLKTLKRQIYGRSAFTSLRQRFLHPP